MVTILTNFGILLVGIVSFLFLGIRNCLEDWGVAWHRKDSNLIAFGVTIAMLIVVLGMVWKLMSLHSEISFEKRCCHVQQKKLMAALEMYQLDYSETIIVKSSEELLHLQKEGYLQKVPRDPRQEDEPAKGTHYKSDDSLRVWCKRHGSVLTYSESAYWPDGSPAPEQAILGDSVFQARIAWNNSLQKLFRAILLGLAMIGAYLLLKGFASLFMIRRN